MEGLIGAIESKLSEVHCGFDKNPVCMNAHIFIGSKEKDKGFKFHIAFEVQSNTSDETRTNSGTMGWLRRPSTLSIGFPGSLTS